MSPWTIIKSTMRLKATTVDHLVEWLASGLVTKDEWRGLITCHGRSADPVDFFSWTLDEYDDFLHSANEFEMVEKVCQKLHHRRPKHARDWLRLMGGVAKGLEAVDAAFKNVPRPALSAEEVSAGFGKTFGLFGVVDALATRQGVADDVIKSMALSAIIGKLTISATRAVAERKHQELCNRRFLRR